MQYSSEIVIAFFEILLLMVKHPEARRMIDWHMRFFDRDVNKLDRNSDLFRMASRMNEELTLCRRCRRSRFAMYNASDMDAAYCQYYINRSPTNLANAWRLFETGRYKIQNGIHSA